MEHWITVTVVCDDPRQEVIAYTVGGEQQFTRVNVKKKLPVEDVEAIRSNGFRVIEHDE